MTQVNIADAEKNLMALLQLLASGQQDEIILTQEGLPNFKITVEKEMTDAEKIQEWARLNKIKKDDEIVTTDENGNPVIIKESELDNLIKTQKSRQSGFGILKDKYNFPPDFDGRNFGRF